MTIERLEEMLTRIDRTMIQQTEQLADHMRRTEVAERNIEILKKHMYMLQGALSLITVAALLAEALRAIH